MVITRDADQFLFGLRLKCGLVEGNSSIAVIVANGIESGPYGMGGRIMGEVEI